jgi:hypothetical protein
MEEIEISSWATIDALKKAADIVETVGNLHSDQEMYVFCVLEEVYLELGYRLAGPNYFATFIPMWMNCPRRWKKEEKVLMGQQVDDEDYDEDLEDEDLDFDDEA